MDKQNDYLFNRYFGPYFEFEISEKNSFEAIYNACLGPYDSGYYLTNENTRKKTNDPEYTISSLKKNEESERDIQFVILKRLLHNKGSIDNIINKMKDTKTRLWKKYARSMD